MAVRNNSSGTRMDTTTWRETWSWKGCAVQLVQAEEAYSGGGGPDAVCHPEANEVLCPVYLLRELQSHHKLQGRGL